MKKVLSISFLLLFVAGFTFGQQYATIRGKVVDEEDNPLPGVTVTLTGVKIATMVDISSEQGNFRFVSLPVADDYILKVELAGFKTVTREQLDISFGRDIQLTITLEQTTLEEEITVVGQTPVIDTKKTQVGINITDEMIMSMPTARNPWVIMAMVPGMLINKEDVGGNEAGQQSSYSGHGSRGRDNTWSIDGASITDNSALGAAPAYTNIASYEEMQVNYGNNDVSAQTGGVQLNLISKRGGNAFAGTFYLDVEDENWQSSNATPELEELFDTYNPGVNRIYLYGANFGGPIVRDRAWFYGSWGVQDIDARNIDGSSDRTWLVSGYAKANFQVTSGTRAEVFLEYDNKNKWGRLLTSAARSGPNYRRNQRGPGYILKAEVEQLFGDFYSDLKFIYMDGGFELIPVAGVPTADMSGMYDIRDRVADFFPGSCQHYGCNRDSYNLNWTNNYFAEDLLNGEHEFKFGVDYVTASTTTFNLRESNLRLEYRGPDPRVQPTGEWWDIWLLRDYRINVWMRRWSAFLQDTMTYGNFSINLGIRYDNETSKVKDEYQPASPWLPQYLPEISLTELDPGVAWKTWSPRAALIWDITGDGKNVAKLNVARYGSQEGFGMAYFINPVGWAEIDVLWQDLNGDTRVTANELFGWDDENEVAVPDGGANPDYWTYYGGFDPDNPTSTAQRDPVDPNFSAPIMDELTLSYEREVITDLALRIEGFYKKDHNNIWNRNMQVPMDPTTVETRDNFYENGTVDIVGTQRWKRDAWFRYDYRTNWEKRYNRYLAAQVVVIKRLSNRWMTDLSFTYSSWTTHWNDDYNNPSNIEYYDGGVNSWMSSRWQFKWSGIYQFPLGLNASWVFRAREGYVNDPYVQHYESYRGWSTYYGDEGGSQRGDNRLPAFYELDFRVEKVWRVLETAQVTFAMDIFNAFNSAIALDTYEYLKSSKFGLTEKILNPRLFRFGIRFDF